MQTRFRERPENWDHLSKGEIDDSRSSGLGLRAEGIMAHKNRSTRTVQDVEMQITPMIDVTFLLLIFFLCSIRFKLFSGKLATHLPKDMGAGMRQQEPALEKIQLVLERADRTPLGFQIILNGIRVPDMRALAAKLKRLHATASDLKVIIHPGDGIEHGHVVKVVNECLRADFREVSFGRTLNEE